MATTTTGQIPSRMPSGEPWLTARKKLLIVGAVLVMALAYFAFQAFNSATVYYYTVAELQGGGSALYGQSLRVKGKLVQDSFRRDAETSAAYFQVQDENGDVLNASYQGAVPDLFFNEHSTITLQGSYQPEGTFTTDSILVKCPSKYLEAGEGGPGIVPAESGQ